MLRLRKSRKIRWKQYLDGSLLVRRDVVQQMPLIVLIIILIFFYIGNRYAAESAAIKKTAMQHEIKDLRSKSVSITAELMNLSKQSEIVKLLKSKGLDLKENIVPPRKILIEHE